jgi:predicted O-methyltransferase YrrM
VILEKNVSDGIDGVEKIRSRLLKNKALLEVTDFGAGSSGMNYRTRIRKISTIAKKSSINRKHAKLLYRIVSESKPRNILEIGTALGISTMYMASAAPESRIVTLEGCAAIEEKARENFRAAGLDNIEVMQGNFNRTVYDALEKFEHLDLVFIDGNHRRESTMNYFTGIIPKLKQSSVIIIHDIHWSKGMTEAWKEICNHEKVSITIDLFRLGIVLFKEDIAKENFVLRF